MLAARDLDAVAGRLRGALGLGEPFADPGVGLFGLRNAVFALGDTFIEVVSPVRENTAAGRLIARRGGDCGYMVMLQVHELTGARRRAAELGLREVFEVALDDISEIHLHPADIRGAIVSLSQPSPPSAWRWGGKGWEQRSAPGALRGVSIAVRDPDEVAARWREVAGELPSVQFVADASEPGLVEVSVAGAVGGELGGRVESVEIAGVRFRRPG